MQKLISSQLCFHKSQKGENFFLDSNFKGANISRGPKSVFYILWHLLVAVGENSRIMS